MKKYILVVGHVSEAAEHAVHMQLIDELGLSFEARHLTLAEWRAEFDFARLQDLRRSQHPDIMFLMENGWMPIAGGSDLIFEVDTTMHDRESASRAAAIRTIVEKHFSGDNSVVAVILDETAYEDKDTLQMWKNALPADTIFRSV